MKTLYVATGNVGKLRDFALAAAQCAGAWRIAPLPDLACIDPPEETGATFAENARLKALYYAQFAPGELVLADDSGLEVDALGGAPGVYSARYAERTGCFADEPGMGKDTRNNACLLQQLAGVPAPRTARYRCALAAAHDGAVLLETDGAVEGEILTQGRGTEGFGYDPLFFLTGRRQTMSELDRATRLGLSHRGEALKKLLMGLEVFTSTGYLP